MAMLRYLCAAAMAALLVIGGGEARPMKQPTAHRFLTLYSYHAGGFVSYDPLSRNLTVDRRGDSNPNNLWLMTAYANAGVYFTLTPHWSVAQESFHLDSPTVQLVNVNSTAEFKNVSHSDAAKLVLARCSPSPDVRLKLRARGSADPGKFLSVRFNDDNGEAKFGFRSDDQSCDDSMLEDERVNVFRNPETQFVISETSVPN